jgi:hypothetical protein
MEYYVYFSFYDKYKYHKHLIIILSKIIDGYDCNIFDPNKKIIKYIWDNFDNSISLSYNEYLKYINEWNNIWWFDDIIFVDKFWDLDVNKIHKLELYDKLELYKEFNGKYDEMVKFYVNEVYNCGYKCTNFMKKFNIFVDGFTKKNIEICTKRIIIKNEYYYVYEYNNIPKKKIVIIIPIDLCFCKCEKFNEDLQISNISYNEYCNLKLNWKELDTYNKISFVNKFRYLNPGKKYILRIYSLYEKILCVVKGKFYQIVNFYIEMLKKNDSCKTNKIIPYEFNLFIEEIIDAK